MSLARDAIIDLEATVAALLRGPTLAEELASAEVVRALCAQDAAPARPPEEVLAKLKRNLKELALTGGNYELVPTRDLRYAPWLLWSADDPFASLPGLVEYLIGRAKERKSLLRGLIEAWIQGYAVDGINIRETGAALRRLVLAHQHPTMQAWARTDRLVRLFDTPGGPRSLALWLIEGTEEASSMLTSVGFDDPLRAVSGYARATQRELLRLAPERLAGRTGSRAATRLFTFLAPEGTLRFTEPQEAGAVARSLLTPWMVVSPKASEESRAAVQEFLLTHLGDPRRNTPSWNASGEDAIAVMRRWVAKATLDTFFRLVSDHALDAHWVYRKAFWGACLKAGAIDDAWLALAVRVHDDARTMRELSGSFAKLTGIGVQGNQSVLLLRVGNLIICDWSHNGRIRAWPIDWGTAPRLFKPLYEKEELMTRGVPFPSNLRGKGGNSDGLGLGHFGSESGYWQESVAKLIAQRTGIRLTEREYMPR